MIHKVNNKIEHEVVILKALCKTYIAEKVISSNKRTLRVLNLEAIRCSAYKQSRTYFTERRIIQNYL